MNEDALQILNEFNTTVVAGIERTANQVPIEEIVNRLIMLGVQLALLSAPNELIGVKTIHAAVQNGINFYEETAS